METMCFNEYQRADTYGLKAMQWKRFIVWDIQQREFLKQYCPDAVYQIAGIIDFTDNAAILNNYDDTGIKIAVFDVTPSRLIKYTSYGVSIAPYYSEELSLQFFSDIGEIADHSKVNLLWKQKRIVGRRFVSKGFIKKRYSIISKLFEVVAPGVSARKLVEESDAVISMPFTSTAIIAKELGKPSIYYDASGAVETDVSHGTPVLKNIDELKNWYFSLNIEKTVISND